MDVYTVATSLISSLGVSLAGAWWLSKALVSHRLQKALESYKSELQLQHDREKLEIEGQIQERVECLLGDRAAEREYMLEAKKRLYYLIGPLKFQLLIACSDAARRIESHGLVAEYKLSLDGYYGISTIYRILRPLAVSELIEQQIAYADFSVDDSSISLLRFKHSATRTLNDDNVIGCHPNVNWNQQTEHLFFDTISEAAHALITVDNNGSKRVIEYYEFKKHFISDHNNNGLNVLAKIIEKFTIKSKPLFWLRLVAFGYNCREYVGTEGVNLDFDYKRYDIRALLERSGDPYIINNLNNYETLVKNSRLQKL